MKRNLLFKTMLLLCAIVVGSLNVWAETVTYTVASTSSVNVSGTAPTGSSATFSNTYSTTKEQMTKDNSQTLTLSKYNGYQITGLTLSMKSNSKGGAGKLRYSTDGGETWTYLVGSSNAGVAFNNSAWHGSWSTSYVDVTKSLNIICGTSDIVIKIEATTSSLYCQSYAVTYEAAKTLDHITLSGTYPTSFTEQDEFSHEGMTVTANYEDSSSKDVTSSATFTGYDMDEIGNQTVTVSYTEGNTTKTATYDITINAGEKYTVSFDPEAGTCGTASLKESAYKGGVTLPAATIGLDGWVFAGWAEASTASTSTRPTLYAAGSTYYPTANTPLYAVYSVEGIGGAQYKRAASVDEVTSASSVAIVTNKNGYILNHTLTDGVSAPSEESGKIDMYDNYVFTLSGNNTEGFTISSTGNKNVGPNGAPTSGSKVLYIDTDITTKWIVEKYNNNDNIFVLRIAGSDGAAMQNYSNDWIAYYTKNYSTDDDGAMKIYVPEVIYNSNPASAIIQPSVAFTSSDQKTLYLDGTKTYTNTASVTGVVKPVSSYTSSNTSVATVNASGEVTAVGIGTATITAKLNAELGVHSAASAEYEVEVKNTTTIAGIKALASTSTQVPFSADLTNAVVTYVNGNHAYIQDESAAIYVNYTNHELAARQKINGAVSGYVKAANQIDQITEIDRSKATVTTDDVIPNAEVKTLAEIKAAGTDYDGKLVTVNAATITGSIATTGNSGASIKDSSQIENTDVQFNIYAPNKGIALTANEKGNFTGFVSIYNGTTYRLNLYEQSQFVKTHNAPANQPLEYANNEVTLSKYTGFSGETTSQELTGAKGTVTYALTGDAIGTINETTGVVTLNGTYGTATITATSAATEEIVDGVIQPYNKTTKSYELTISQIFEVTFSINGEVKKVRQESAGAAVEVPAVQFLGNKVFVGWGEVSDATATVEMGATYTPTADKTFFALFATATTEVSNVKKSIIATDTGVPTSYDNSATKHTINEIDYMLCKVAHFSNSGKLQFKADEGYLYNKTEMTKIQSIVLTYNSGDDKKNFTVKVGASQNPTSDDEITASVSGSVYTFDCSAKNANYFVIKNGSGAGFLDKIEINYKNEVTTYSDYTSNVGTTNVIIDGNAESIDLSAMNDITALVGVHADEITYTRTMGKLSTLYLPYASTIPDGMTAYEFNGINVAGTALNFNVVEGTTLNAYTPYVLEQNASASQTLSATDVDIVADTNGEIIKGDWMLKGTVSKIENADLLTEAGTGTPYVVQSDAKWHPVQSNANAYIPAFRAYFIASAGSGAKVMDMNLGGETTSITNLDVNDDLDENVPIFNLAGQKVTKTYKGVVIQNGKKVVRK